MLPLGNWLRPLKLASSLVKVISTVQCLSRPCIQRAGLSCSLVPRPSSLIPMVLMKLSSGRVSRTNRRFNFLNALISPVGYWPPFVYPKDVAGCLVKTRLVLDLQLQATPYHEILLLRKVSYPRIQTRHTSYSWLSPPRVVACHATWPSCCPLLFPLSSFLKCITAIAITCPPNLRVVWHSNYFLTLSRLE